MTIKEKIKLLPACSGVYIFKNSQNNIIYVGSSVSLNKRVASYFYDKGDIKIKRLAENIYDFDYIATTSLKEALILESNLIKKHKPKFNIKLKDDKKYPFIEIAYAVKYPYTRITRNLNNSKSAYFGPYTNVKSLRRILYILREMFKIRTCKHDIASKKIKGCIYKNIKLCSAPCLGCISEKDYSYNINRVTDFLSGKISYLSQELKKKIKEESKLLNFEACSYFQNILNEIKLLAEKQQAFFQKNINADYIGIYNLTDKSSVSFLQIREGKLIEEKNFIFENLKTTKNSEIIVYLIRKIYPDINFSPFKFYTDIKIEDKNYLKEELSEKVKIYRANKGVNKDILELAKHNAQMKLSALFHGRNISSEILKRLKEALYLKNIPIIIKAIDVSNIHGSFPAASVVCFKNGMPDKNNYRHYIIQGQASPNHSLCSGTGHSKRQGAKTAINDYAMIAEAVRRNLTKKEDRPDLLIIDGGKGHLNTALKTLKEMDITDVELISIAKREELIYTPLKKEAMNIHKYPDLLNMLKYIRDEAHRFALRLHRKRRGIAALS